MLGVAGVCVVEMTVSRDVLPPGRFVNSVSNVWKRAEKSWYGIVRSTQEEIRP